MLLTIELLTIAVGCVFYQDREGIERLLDSCWKEVDYIFLIDGKFRNYDSIFPMSTDNFEDILYKYPNVFYDVIPNMLEHEKRTRYLEMCRSFRVDYLLIVDSDEYFHPDSDWKAFRQEIARECQHDYIFNLKNYTAIEGMMLPVDQPRLWRSPSLLEYKNDRHYQFGLKGSSDLLVAKKTLYSVKLMHDPHLRSIERTDEHDKYIKWLEEYEKMKQLIETNKEKSQREYVVWNS